MATGQIANDKPSVSDVPNYSDLLHNMKAEIGSQQEQQEQQQQQQQQQQQLQYQQQQQQQQDQQRNVQFQMQDELLKNQQMLEQHFNQALTDQNAKLEAMQAGVQPSASDCQTLSIQHETGLLMLICILVQFPSFQAMLRKRIPSMYTTDTLSIIGVIFNAVVMSVIFIMAKHLMQKYAKEY
jgi:cation transport ATPase